MQSANKSLRVPLSTKHERLDRTKGKREVLNHPQKVREREKERERGRDRGSEAPGVDHVVWLATDSLYWCVHAYIFINY